MKPAGRNAPCPCGSGKKYKQCCLSKSSRDHLPFWKVFAHNKRTALLLTVIFFASVALRWYGFTRPHGFTFDEGLYAELLAPQLQEDPTNYSTKEAYEALTAQGQRLPEYLDRPLFKHPPLYLYFMALSYSLFGPGMASAVAISIFFGSLMVLAVFFLGKIIYDERVGILAALFLALDPIHWICSEKIWMETTMSFFMLLAVLFFVLGMKEERYLSFSGLSVGLGLVVKYPAALSLFVMNSFAFFFERRLLRSKGFWFLNIACLLVFRTAPLSPEKYRDMTTI